MQGILDKAESSQVVTGLSFLAVAQPSCDMVVAHYDPRISKAATNG